MAEERTLIEPARTGGIPPAPSPRPGKPLELSSAVALVVASMIGAGVFTTSGFLLADLRSPNLVILAWLVGGLMASLGALTYGELARRLPESGGEYLFLSRTIHPAAGCAAGWISLLVGFSAPLAAAAYGFGEYTKTWFGMPAQVTGSVVILLCAALHGWEVKRGARAQDWAVFIKIILIGGLILFGLGKIDFGSPMAPATPFPSSVFAVSLVWISFSYSGWNAAIYVAGEVRDAPRNLPRALLIGTGLVTLLYAGLNAVFVYSAPFEELAGKLEIGRVAARALGGSGLEEAVTALIALALLTSVSSMLMAGPRVYGRMATDGYLPRVLALGEGPPRAAILLQTILALGLLWTAAYESLLTYIGFTLALSTAASALGLLLVQRREQLAIRRPAFKLFSCIPILYIATVLAMTGFTVMRRPLESLAGLATICLGWAMWAWRARRPV